MGGVVVALVASLLVGYVLPLADRTSATELDNKVLDDPDRTRYQIAVMMACTYDTYNFVRDWRANFARMRTTQHFATLF